MEVGKVSSYTTTLKLVLSYRDGLQLAGHYVDISASICMVVHYLQHRVTGIISHLWACMARPPKQALYFPPRLLCSRHCWANFGLGVPRERLAGTI